MYQIVSHHREIAVIRHLQRYQSRGAEQFLALLRDYAKVHSGADTPSHPPFDTTPPVPR